MSWMSSGNGSWSYPNDSEKPWVQRGPQFSLICTKKKIQITEENANSSSKSLRERESREEVLAELILESFVAKSTMLFTWALTCIPRKDRVSNHMDPGLDLSNYTDKNQFFSARQF